MTVLTASVAVSACGAAAGRTTAAQLMPELQATAARASSVHIAGSVIQGKQATTIDVSIDGDSVAGFLGANGTRFFVLSLNGQSSSSNMSSAAAGGCIFSPATQAGEQPSPGAR